MFAIKKAEETLFINEQSTFDHLPHAKRFATVQEAVNFVHTFHGEVVDENIDETGATIAMSGNQRDLRIYEVVEIK